MEIQAVKLRQLKFEKFVAAPGKLLAWTLQGKLRANLKLAQQYRQVAESELFDSFYYRAKHTAALAKETDPLRHYLTEGWRAGFNPSPLFDGRWYLEQNPDVASRGMNPLVHFVTAGWREGRNPHPLFDLKFYGDRNPDVARIGMNPLLHYVKTGTSEYRDPHPLFSNRFYLERYPDVALQGANPLAHYLEAGWKERRDPHPLFSTSYYLRQQPELGEGAVSPLLHFVIEGFRKNINPNPLFDTAYYTRTNPDVLASDANPLAHYVSSGAAEFRWPHPLFDPTYYLCEAAQPTDGSVEPLAHYLSFGAGKTLSPHPLFDVSFYLEQQGGALPTSPALIHYLEQGTGLGLDPCELFDTSFYLKSYPEVAESGENPLAHYLTKGALAGNDPNPLFDSSYYLKQYADVAAIGQNPLAHYMEEGASEGRAPGPFFDSRFYLRKNPQLARAGINPLAHYLRGAGVAAGLDPSPFFSTRSYLQEHPEVAAQQMNPLVHFLGFETTISKATEPQNALPPTPPKVFLRVRNLFKGQPPHRAPKERSRTVICVSHISPGAPRAGNEYRLNRLLNWFRAAGYDVLPVLSPLGGSEISEGELLELADAYGEAVLCQRDGLITCCLHGKEAQLLREEQGRLAASHAEQLGENKLLDARQLALLETDRTFCHDALIHILMKLIPARESCIVLAEYIFMSRFLPLLGAGVLKMIDTHDVFSSKRDKVVAFGVSDSLSLSEAEESERLMRADLILAIQPEENEILQRLTEYSRRVVTVGVDFSTSETDREPAGKTVLYVGSDNAMNVQGLRDFLRFAWPQVLRQAPDARLLVAGSVCNSVRYAPPGVELLGRVADLLQLYNQAKLAINPAVAGTGLKIKTVEALSFLRPIVTWPAGADGLSKELAGVCRLAADWFEFQQEVVSILHDSKRGWFDDEQRALIRDQLSARSAYASLQRELSRTAEETKVAAV